MFTLWIKPIFVPFNNNLSCWLKSQIASSSREMGFFNPRSQLDSLQHASWGHNPSFLAGKVEEFRIKNQTYTTVWLTLLWLVLSHIYVTWFPYEKYVKCLFVLTVKYFSFDTQSCFKMIKYLQINYLTGAAIGDCVTDSFTLSAPGNKGSPQICGFNTGQHSKFNL